ncbi:MAG: MMPL family transporter [Microbacteriaceae bacterium]|nr:MMPL family transporter [Microbacteriaceae bacterium]
MADSLVRKHFSDRLTSRKGAWVSLGLVLLVLVALFGFFTGAQAPERTGHAPSTSESTQVDELMQQFPDAGQQSVLTVVTRDDGAALSGEDLTKIDEMLPVLNQHADGETQKPRISEDGKAAALVTPVVVGETNTDTAELMSSLRDDIAANTPAGMSMLVTGGPAFGADVAAAFDGADFTLLLVTILIVAILLIITYRSPVLWLIPLIVVALGDGLAGRVTAAAGEAWNLEFDAGIISVLVFGAGTNYALLLISRYREELLRHEDHRAALSVAWRKTVPAILASNVTVVLALLTLILASIPMTRGLGIPAALGLIIALGAVLFLLPPLLAIFGRKIFWPFIPKPGDTRESGRAWRGIASKVAKRPGVSLVAGLALLAVMATGLLGSSVGLSQLEKFSVQSESATGLEVLSEHFPPGEAQPIFIVSNSHGADDVLEAVRDSEGVVRAVPIGTTDDETLTKIMVTSEYGPSTEESIAQIGDLRELVHGIEGADALVGGAVATDVDARGGNEADLWLVAPLVLAVSFVVLLFLLRSLVAPVLLLLVNLASAVAAIGAGSWLSRIIFEQPALDLQVPLLAFLFLVALGIDYTIFLVHRARSEASMLGTRAGMVEAVAHTGSVITSAGIVLAAVFAALGVLPLVTLGQLGLIVGIGVIVDTLIVRTVIVPSIFSLMGDRIWLPGKLKMVQPEHKDQTVEPVADNSGPILVTH